MQKQGSILLLSILLLYPCVPSAAFPSRHTMAATSRQSVPKIGPIDKPLVNGCGCYLRLPEDERQENKRYLFMSDFSGLAQMNLDSKDLKLKPVKQTKAEGKPTVGLSRSETYIAGPYTIDIEWRVKKVCDPEDTGCEVVEYSAVIKVSRDGQTQKVEALGPCGC
jgi:hypothetical protein